MAGGDVSSVAMFFLWVFNFLQVFIFLRWCVAIASVALFTSGYVYCMEMVNNIVIANPPLPHNFQLNHHQPYHQVGGVWCTLIGIGLEFPWAFGYMSLPLVPLPSSQRPSLNTLLKRPRLKFESKPFYQSQILHYNI